MDLASGHWPAGQQLNHPAPGGIGQRGKEYVARVFRRSDIYHLYETYHVAMQHSGRAADRQHRLGLGQEGLRMDQGQRRSKADSDADADQHSPGQPLLKRWTLGLASAVRERATAGAKPVSQISPRALKVVPSTSSSGSGR